MEKETAYSNLMGSSDELLFLASMGVQEDFIQRVSSAVCESMRNEWVKDYDETILTNFLKNCHMVAQAAFHWGVAPILMKILRARTMVGDNLVREKDTMVLIFQINCTICHTIIIMVHPVVINEMGFQQ